MAKPAMKWTAIALTCQNKETAYSCQKELDFLQKKGFIDADVLLLAVEDPKATIGSGGATMNALLVIAEHLSARQGYTVVNGDVLYTSHILLLHMGRNYPYDPCGRAFVAIPAMHHGSQDTGYSCLMYNINSLLDTMTTKISPGSPPGVWICSTDMFLTIESQTNIDWEDFNGTGICGIAVPGSKEYARNHGVYKINKQGDVKDIVYRGTKTAVEMCSMPDDSIALVTGVVFISASVAEKLLVIHVLPPIGGCTYMGLDSGEQPIQFSLFFDFLLCMASEVTEDDFVNGSRALAYGSSLSSLSKDQLRRMASLRQLVWKEFRGTKLKAVCLSEGKHDYMSLSALTHHKQQIMCPIQLDDDKTWIWKNDIYSHVQSSCSLPESSFVINSKLTNGIKVGEKCAITHSELEGPFIIGKDSILKGIDFVASKQMKGLTLQDGIIMQGINIQLGGPQTKGKPFKVYTVMGKFDDLKTTFVKGTSTYCNMPWIIFLQRTGIDKEDIWPADKTDYVRSLFNAKLFPVWHCTEDVGIKELLWLQGAEIEDNDVVLQRWKESWRLSLQDISQCVDINTEFQLRRDMSFQIGQADVKTVLAGMENKSLLPFFKSAVVEGYSDCLLVTLDTVASETDSPGVAARTLACIADVLGCISALKGSGGLRSGPAANKAWAKAFHKLEEGNIAAGVMALAAERLNWMDRADLLVRAARHYEGAEQILIRHAVMTARQFISSNPCEVAPIGQWIVARCPARIDISGGWSDTPPITYENGGAVTNAAITIDGKKPIGAKCRRIIDPHLVLVLGKDTESARHLVIKELCDLSDYTNPQSSAALLKAAFICADVISFKSGKSLQDQLMNKYGSGFELQTWSNLPQGSGLGTSSILAGAVIAAVWKASGRMYSNDSLIHAVLHLEQMLTTGGGWQDQVGGLTPGIKIGRSNAALPLKVDTTYLNVSVETITNVNKRLVLLYTGKTRLARNLLQDVIRNWYARLPKIVNNCDALTANAELCAKAFEAGDIEKVGECLNTYWSQKKVMAPGCEPKLVGCMMEALKPSVYGQALAGAGGGGFMYVLTKKPNAIDDIKQVLTTLEGCENVTIHKVHIDETGLTVGFEDDTEGDSSNAVAQSDMDEHQTGTDAEIHKDEVNQSGDQIGNQNNAEKEGDQTGDEKGDQTGDEKEGDQTGAEKVDQTGAEKVDQTGAEKEDDQTGDEKGDQTGDEKDGDQTGDEKGDQTGDEKEGDQTGAEKEGDQTGDEKEGDQNNVEKVDQTGDEKGDQTVAEKKGQTVSGMKDATSTEHGDQTGSEKSDLTSAEKDDQTGNENGDHTGAEQGDQTGAEQGDQTGTENGDQTGDENGDHTGAEKGDQTGAEKGDQTGDEQGDQTGTEKGDQTGAENGDQTGAEQGN